MSANSFFKQPGWDHVFAAFVAGAREARANPDADETVFAPAADAYTKLIFSEVDPETHRRIGENDWPEVAPAEQPQPDEAWTRRMAAIEAEADDPWPTVGVPPAPAEQPQPEPVRVLDDDARSALNAALCDFARRWKLDGDWLTCKGCKCSLIASRADETLRHAEGCKLAATTEPRPWQALLTILRPLYVHAPPAPAEQPQPVAWRYPMYWWQPMEQHAEWHYITDIKRISAAAHDAGVVPEPLYAAPPPPAAAPAYGSIAERAAAGKDAGMWPAAPTDAMVEAALEAMHGAPVDYMFAGEWRDKHRAKMRAAIDAALKAREGR